MAQSYLNLENSQPREVKSPYVDHIQLLEHDVHVKMSYSLVQLSVVDSSCIPLQMVEA